MHKNVEKFCLKLEEIIKELLKVILPLIYL